MVGRGWNGGNEKRIEVPSQLRDKPILFAPDARATVGSSFRRIVNEPDNVHGVAAGVHSGDTVWLRCAGRLPGKPGTFRISGSGWMDMIIECGRLVISLAFSVQMYLSMALFAGIFAPLAIADRRFAFQAVHLYSRWVRWTARWMVGLRSEVRGDVPLDEVIIASKHQSFFDIILLVSVLPRPKFIMKKELRWTPILGWFAKRIGCIPVDRGKRGAAIARMKDDVSESLALPGQLVIYPQGTRVAPGVRRAYKAGAAVLYLQLGQACVPAATNAGLFWPRRSIMRRPGLAVLEFLPRIPAGKDQATFMADLEGMIEARSDQLMIEAGFGR